MNDPAENTNTDTEIWRERPGDYYSDALFVTIDGALGIDVGGTVFVKPLRKWQELEAENAKLRAEVNEWRECARYDPMMSGEARFKGWDRSQMDRCRKRFIEARAIAEPDAAMVICAQEQLKTDTVTS